MIFTVTLNPALDYILKVDNLRFDDISRAKYANIYYGGKGINVSVVLTRLGMETTAMGFLGGFTGKKLEEMLVNDHINCDFTHISGGDTRINVKIKADCEIDINASGPNVSKEEINTLLKKIECINSGDCLVLSGSIPASMPEDIYENILSRLHSKGIRFVVDTTDEMLKNSLKYNPFLIKPNHHELGDLFGVKIKSDEDIVKYAKELQKLGAENVLVSCASEGAILVSSDGICRKIKNADGTLVNSVGCGDSMVAGFIAGYIEKGDFSYALQLGAACGNATAFSEELATKEEIEKILSCKSPITILN